MFSVWRTSKFHCLRVEVTKDTWVLFPPEDQLEHILLILEEVLHVVPVTQFENDMAHL
jgi:hypothetical protein